MKVKNVFNDIKTENGKSFALKYLLDVFISACLYSCANCELIVQAVQETDLKQQSGDSTLKYISIDFAFV